jgi:hypothetical protein
MPRSSTAASVCAVTGGVALVVAMTGTFLEVGPGADMRPGPGRRYRPLGPGRRPSAGLVVRLRSCYEVGTLISPEMIFAL